MPIPGTMKIDTAVMMNAAQTVAAQRTIMENCISNIIRDAGSLKNVWDGESANAYQTAILKIKENAPEMLKVLQRYTEDLNEIAFSFLTEEEKRKIIAQSLPTDVF